MRKLFITSDAKTPEVALNLQGKCHKSSRENPAMLACDAKNRHDIVFRDRAMRSACGSDSRCCMACDASDGDVKIEISGGVRVRFRVRFQA